MRNLKNRLLFFTEWAAKIQLAITSFSAGEFDRQLATVPYVRIDAVHHVCFVLLFLSLTCSFCLFQVVTDHERDVWYYL